MLIFCYVCFVAHFVHLKKCASEGFPGLARTATLFSTLFFPSECQFMLSMSLVLQIDGDDPVNLRPVPDLGKSFISITGISLLCLRTLCLACLLDSIYTGCNFTWKTLLFLHFRQRFLSKPRK